MLYVSSAHPLQTSATCLRCVVRISLSCGFAPVDAARAHATQENEWTVHFIENGFLSYMAGECSKQNEL